MLWIHKKKNPTIPLLKSVGLFKNKVNLLLRMNDDSEIFVLKRLSFVFSFCEVDFQGHVNEKNSSFCNGVFPGEKYVSRQYNSKSLDWHSNIDVWTKDLNSANTSEYIFDKFEKQYGPFRGPGLSWGHGHQKECSIKIWIFRYAFCRQSVLASLFARKKIINETFTCCFRLNVLYLCQTKEQSVFLSVSKKWSTNHFCTIFRISSNPGNNVKIMFDK